MANGLVVLYRIRLGKGEVGFDGECWLQCWNLKKVIGQRKHLSRNQRKHAGCQQVERQSFIVPRTLGRTIISLEGQMSQGLVVRM